MIQLQKIDPAPELGIRTSRNRRDSAIAGQLIKIELQPGRSYTNSPSFPFKFGASSRRSRGAFSVFSQFSTNGIYDTLDQNSVASREIVRDHRYWQNIYFADADGVRTPLSPQQATDIPFAIWYERIELYKINELTVKNPILDENIVYTRGTIRNQINLYKDELKDINKSTRQLISEEILLPYSTKFIVYNEPSNSQARLDSRLIQGTPDVAHLSSSIPGEYNTFSVGYRDFFRDNFSVSYSPYF